MGNDSFLSNLWKMRIGFDSKRLFNNFTGLGNYSRTLVRNLGRFFKEHEYYLYSPKLKRTPETALFLDQKPFYAHGSDSFFKSYWRTYSIIDLLKKDKIELYHGLSHEIPVGLQKSKIKSVVTIHDLIFKIYPDLFNLLDRKIYDRKYKYSCYKADKIIAISNNTKSDIVDIYGIDPDKIEVIYQPCDPIYYDPSPIESLNEVLARYNIPNEYFLCVGSVEKRKNLKLILESYQQMTDGRRIPLVMTGRGRKYGKEISGIIKEKGLEKNVLWISDLHDNFDLKAVYCGSLALIYPSLYEGFGLPVVEAMLSKTPVITSYVSSLPEAGGPDSLYIDPKDPESLTDAINKILDDSGQRERMIKSGYEYANRKFNERQTTRQVMDCYLSTMNG